MFLEQILHDFVEQIIATRIPEVFVSKKQLGEVQPAIVLEIPNKCSEKCLSTFVQRLIRDTRAKWIKFDLLIDRTKVFDFENFLPNVVYG